MPNRTAVDALAKFRAYQARMRQRGCAHKPLPLAFVADEAPCAIKSALDTVSALAGPEAPAPKSHQRRS